MVEQLIKKPLVMVGTTGNTLMEVPNISPAFQFINITNLTGNVIYLCSENAPDKTMALYGIGAYSTLSIPITPEITNVIKIFWEDKENTPLISKTAQFIFSYQNLGYNQCYAPGFSIQNSSLQSNIVNLTSSPAQIQAAAGSYDTPNYINIVTVAGDNLLLAAGNYVSKIRLSLIGPQGSSLYIKNGSNIIYEDSQPGTSIVTYQVDLDFAGSGIYNSGIKFNNTYVGWNIYGIITTSSLTPKNKVSVIS